MFYFVFGPFFGSLALGFLVSFFRTLLSLATIASLCWSRPGNQGRGWKS